MDDVVSEAISLDAAKKIVEIAKEAGRAILEVYGTDDFSVEYKDDNSPLTEADKRSHEIIEKRLKEMTPDVPVLSEEGKEIPLEDRKDWEIFYLVDPLDGTKEFIKRNGEFTVNIAIIDRGRPSVGVIYVPVQDVTYFAAEEQRAYKQIGDEEPFEIVVSGKLPSDSLVAVASRSHGSEEVEKFLESYDVKERTTAGSSLKFCLVAEGKADIYPRFGPTWEWDTAAGHAILLEAGGRLIHTGSKDEIKYNKPVIKHEGFIAASTVFIERMNL
jgi:3'(2'), 5'-bisphosphate nucleotidase